MGGRHRPASKHLEWISFYDFHYLPMELLHLGFDELSIVLGGGSFADCMHLACGVGRRGSGASAHAAWSATPSESRSGCSDWIRPGDSGSR